MSSSSSSAITEDFKSTALFDVSHVTAVVTGGATGIGLMITQALVANGAKVYITGRRREKLESVVKLYGAGEHQGRIVAVVGDVSSRDGCVKIAEEVGKSEPQGIQLLVNNAGIARDSSTAFAMAGEPDHSSADSISAHYLKSTDAVWAETYQTNVTAQFFMSMAFVPLLAKGNSRTPGYTSSVVNLSSISGMMKGPSEGALSYASSKAASTHLSRMLATAFKDVKVRVNVIAPGAFPSELTTGKSDESGKSQMDKKSYNPAGRKGEESDMAGTILFLAGKGGVFYNEQILVPDGGNLLTTPAQK